MHACDNRTLEAPIVGTVPADVEDTWHATLRFQSGVTVTWTYSRFLYGPELRFANYYGREGTLQDLGFPFHPFQGGGDALLADGTTVSQEAIQTEYLSTLTGEQKDRLFPYGSTDGFAVEVWDFVNAVASGRKPEMDGHDGLRAKALCECCYESAVAGKPVKFVDVIEGRVDAYQKPIDDFWHL
jgi:predicted dehydrogenase